MKKCVFSTIALVILVFLTACSNISQTDYQTLQNELSTANDSLSKLQSDFNTFKSENKDFQQFSDNQKQAALEVAKRQDEISKLDQIIKEKEAIISTNETKLLSLNDEIANLENKKQVILATNILKRGQYLVGEDINEGKYNVTATSGSGNFQGTVASLTMSLNEILEAKDSYGYTAGSEIYSNLRLQNGDVFEIKGNLILKFDRIK